MRFTVFQVPDPLPAGTSVSEMHYGEGGAFEVVCKLLDYCSLQELEALKLRGIAAAQRRVKARVEEFELAEFGRTGVLFPANERLAVAEASGAVELDEDDEDDLLEPTPLEVDATQTHAPEPR